MNPQFHTVGAFRIGDIAIVLTDIISPGFRKTLVNASFIKLILKYKENI